MSSIKKNFMYQTMFQVLSMILPLITSPLLAKQLGPEGIGIYSYVNTILSYFILFANMGVYKYGIREIAATKDNKNNMSKVFWEIWYFHLIISFIIGIIYFIFSLFTKKYKIYFFLSLFSYIGNIININWLFTGLEDFKKVSLRDMAFKIIAFFLIIFFVRGDNSLVKYFILMVSCNFFGSWIFWIMAKNKINNSNIKISGIFSHWKGMLILFIPVLLESLYANMDKVMLGIMRPKSEVGFYENADKALIARTIICSITIVLMPKMTNILKNKETNKFDELMKKSTNIIVLLSSAFAFGTAAVSKEFSNIFWGSNFDYCTNLIIIMAMAMPGALLSREIREQYLIPASKDKQYLFSAGMGAIINLIVNLILIPIYGAIGAAIATLISEYSVLFFQMYGVRKELKMTNYLKGNSIYVLFGIIMFIIIRIYGNYLGIHIYTLLSEIILGAIIFSTLCYTYWKITKNTYYLDLFSSIIKKLKKKKENII